MNISTAARKAAHNALDRAIEELEQMHRWPPTLFDVVLKEQRGEDEEFTQAEVHVEMVAMGDHAWGTEEVKTSIVNFRGEEI